MPRLLKASSTGILEEDQGYHRNQRHTAKKIFERVRDGHGFTGGQTIAKAYGQERRHRLWEMFVPRVYPPGHAQVDFGEAMAVIGGVALKVISSPSTSCVALPPVYREIETTQQT